MKLWQKVWAKKRDLFIALMFIIFLEMASFASKNKDVSRTIYFCSISLMLFVTILMRSFGVEWIVERKEIKYETHNEKSDKENSEES